MQAFISCNYGDITNGFTICGAICTVVSLIFAILTYIIAKKGIEIMSELKRNQHAAAYGFYSNIQTYFTQLEGFIYNSTDMADWLVLLGYNTEKINSMGQKSTKIVNADKCAIIADKFLDFLAQTQNQVPPNGKNYEQWDKYFEILREYLFNIANYRLTAYTKWNEGQIEGTFKEFTTAIDGINGEIKSYKKNLYNKLKTKE